MKNNLNHTGQILDLLSFVIGTSVLAFYLYFGVNFFPIGLAVAFIISAIILNSILCIAIIGNTVLHKRHVYEAIKTYVLMLLNIPIAGLYLCMVITFPYQHMLL
ncbi:MAG: hypothetical protein ACJAZK_002497 [Psychroserpens sp.]|jgi:hypothetical protein|uniref:hypothetical protein n=1 Tax=Psychroserpens sp. TaxID=2020870 RepID=UPI0039E2984E